MGDRPVVLHPERDPGLGVEYADRKSGPWRPERTTRRRVLGVTLPIWLFPIRARYLRMFHSEGVWASPVSFHSLQGKERSNG